MAATKIGFIGAGHMATILAKSFVAQNTCGKEDILMHGRNPHSQEQIKKLGYTSCSSNNQIILEADYVILAIKPNDVSSLVNMDFTTKKTIFISVCAGVSANYLSSVTECPWIRAMPNTLSIVGHGTTAIAEVDDEYKESLTKAVILFQSIGIVEVVKENQMNAVTGLSGSGPAYVYMFLEALSDAGVLQGLTRKTSNALAANTVLGAAKMMQESTVHPAILKAEVTSPGGTTIAAVAVLEKAGFRNAVIEAVSASAHRASTIGPPKI